MDYIPLIALVLVVMLLSVKSSLGGEYYMKEIIIVPDVHGRKFWHNAMSHVETTPIVFLGDYLDPYYWDEGIDSDQAYEQLDEIIDFKRSFQGNVTLLLGNHDLHYLAPTVGGCRYDHRFAYQNKALLWSNLEYFDIAHSVEGKRNQYLFSHAGVIERWYYEHFPDSENISAEEIAMNLNDAFHHGNTSRETMIDALSESSALRGGGHPYGSPVWADKLEHRTDAYEFGTIYQIFGHTLGPMPVITPFWACLDCKRCFRLNIESGLITEL